MPKTNLQEQLKSLSNKRRASESEFSFPNELMSPAKLGLLLLVKVLKLFLLIKWSNIQMKNF